MGTDKRIIQGKMEVAGIMGPIWFMGWLFTIGFVGLPVSKAIFAAVIWPFYLGTAIR